MIYFHFTQSWEPMNCKIGFLLATVLPLGNCEGPLHLRGHSRWSLSEIWSKGGSEVTGDPAKRRVNLDGRFRNPKCGARVKSMRASADTLFLFALALSLAALSASHHSFSRSCRASIMVCVSFLSNGRVLQLSPVSCTLTLLKSDLPMFCSHHLGFWFTGPGCRCSPTTSTCCTLQLSWRRGSTSWNGSCSLPTLSSWYGNSP